MVASRGLRLSTPSIPPTPQPAHGRLRADPLNEDLAVHNFRPFAASAQSAARKRFVWPSAGALGVVFGDIGTSPIYTIQTVFNPNDPHPVPISADNVRRRVIDFLVGDDHRHADLRDPGACAPTTMARAASWRYHAAEALGRRSPAHRHGADHAGLGAALFFGDMITPAISVLSAVEGIKVIEPELEKPDRADHRGDHRRAVRRAAPRHGRRWALCSGR